jgi:hypothetical protein
MRCTARHSLASIPIDLITCLPGFVKKNIVIFGLRERLGSASEDLQVRPTQCTL